MARKRAIITGGDGYVGRHLVDALAKEYEVFPTVVKSKNLKNEEIVDITIADDVSKMIAKIKPDLIIHTAGLSSLGECEKDPENAKKINFLGTKNIADCITGHKTKLVFFSSDYVFDGKRGNYKENDVANSKTVYGQTKLEAENYIKNNLNNFIIIRTANIFGDGGNFFNFICGSLEQKQEVEVFSNVFFTPTYIHFLTDSLVKLVQKDFIGTIHIAGKDKVSRYQFAQKIALSLLGQRSPLLKATKQIEGLISTDSSLNCELLTSEIKTYVPSIDEALKHNFYGINIPYFWHKDHRGLIRGITQSMKIEELNYIESLKGCERGGHYHEFTSEGFYVISGLIRVTMQNISTNICRSFTAKKGDVFIIEPGWTHNFVALSNSSWINFLSKKMDVGSPDIHKLDEGQKNEL